MTASNELWLLYVTLLRPLYHISPRVLVYAIVVNIVGSLVMWGYSSRADALLGVGTSTIINLIGFQIGFLVTQRPSYALQIHDDTLLQISQLFASLHSMLQSISFQRGETMFRVANRAKSNPDNALADMWLAYLASIETALRDKCDTSDFFVASNMQIALKKAIGDRDMSVFTDPMNSIVGNLYKIFLSRRKPIPRDYHDICLIVILIFHALFLPIFLYDTLQYPGIVANFIITVFNVSYIDASKTISDPLSKQVAPSYYDLPSICERSFQNLRDIVAAIL